MQTSAFYDTLFGDLPLAEWAGQGEKLDMAPWPAFREAAAFQAAGQLAQAQLMSGDSAAARETATGGLARLTAEPPTGFYVLEGCAGLADVFLELDDRPMATKAVKRLGAFARSFPLGRPRHLLAQGRLQALNGKRSAAEKLMRKALDEARRLALPRDIALAERHLGRLAGDGRQAAAA